MPRPPSRVSDLEAVADARRRYEIEGEHRDVIAAETGLSRRVIDARALEENWRRRRRSKPAPKASAPPSARKVAAPTASAPPEAARPAAPEPTRADLAVSITQAVERELAAIDAVLARLGTSRLGADEEGAGEAERTARTLASLARALKELKQLDARRTEPSGLQCDDMPRDIDEFRRELARRMDALVASRADARLPGGSGNRDT